MGQADVGCRERGLQSAARTYIVNDVVRKTFPVLSIVAIRIFSQQKHAAVRCVRSSDVSPAVLRRCKAVYPCAYSRNKAKKGLY